MCSLSITTNQEAMRRRFTIKQHHLGNFGSQPAPYSDAEITILHEAKEGGCELVNC